MKKLGVILLPIIISGCFPSNRNYISPRYSRQRVIKRQSNSQNPWNVRGFLRDQEMQFSDNREFYDSGSAFNSGEGFNPRFDRNRNPVIESQERIRRIRRHNPAYCRGPARTFREAWDQLADGADPYDPEDVHHVRKKQAELEMKWARARARHLMEEYKRRTGR